MNHVVNMCPSTKSVIAAVGGSNPLDKNPQVVYPFFAAIGPNPVGNFLKTATNPYF